MRRCSQCDRLSHDSDFDNPVMFAVVDDEPPKWLCAKCIAGEIVKRGECSVRVSDGVRRPSFERKYH